MSLLMMRVNILPHDDMPIEIQRALQKMRKGLLNRQEPHDDAGEYMTDRVDEFFRDEVTAEGAPWADLAESTKKRKISEGRNPEFKLEESGLLRKLSTRWETMSLQPGLLDSIFLGHRTETVTRISPVYIGKTRTGKRRHDIKSWVHQEGSPKNRTPARPYLGVTDAHRTHINKIFLRWAEQILAEESRKV